MYKVWEAGLEASILVRKVNLPFDGLESLLLNSDYKVAVLPDSVYADEIKYSNILMWQKAWKERVEPYLEDYKPYYGKLKAL